MRLTVAALLLALIATPLAAQEVSWPAPITAGGATPVSWGGIGDPSPFDWVGLYFPESPDDYSFVDWVYVSCSQVPNVARGAGTCGFVIPASVPPGFYEFRLYAADGFTRLATSPPFEVLDGGWR